MWQKSSLTYFCKHFHTFFQLTYHHIFLWTFTEKLQTHGFQSIFTYVYKNLKEGFQKAPSFSCPNPNCPVGYRSFNTVKGYQNHLTHSPVCTEYASRQLSLQSLACQPTQPIATAMIPTSVLDPGISTNSTLYPAYARVNQHDCLNPEYPNGTIPDYQDFQIFGDIEEAAINNEGRRCQ